jgi:ribulose-phosphate 3-epimerase
MLPHPWRSLDDFMIIAPSLLSADFINLSKELKKISETKADLLHLDVMDGHFVPNLTFGMPIIEQIKKSCSMPLDVHLMVTNPQLYFEPLADIGVQYISFHQETVFHLHRYIQEIKKHGIKAGIALNPATPVNTLFDILPDLDFVLVMSVNPGFGGQKFLPLALKKILELKEQAKTANNQLQIQVDGGVTHHNAKLLKDAGADILVAGSYIFGKNDYSVPVNTLKNA